MRLICGGGDDSREGIAVVDSAQAGYGCRRVYEGLIAVSSLCLDLEFEYIWLLRSSSCTISGSRNVVSDRVSKKPLALSAHPADHG